MNPTPQLATSESRTDGMYRLMKRVLWVLVCIWALLVLGWGSLHLFIVPRIDDYRPLLQRQASQTLRLRVEIANVSVLGGWWAPQLRFQDIQLFDAHGREALRLPYVDVVVSARSLLRGTFEQLVIDQPELDIRRDKQGNIWVAGLDTSQASDGSGLDWFFSQPEFLIRDGVLHWRDELRDSPELSLSHVNVVMQNSFHQHLMRVDVTPPVGLGQRLSVQGKFSQNPLQRSGDLRHWSGELYANAPDIDLSLLRQWLRFDRGIAIYEGKGGVRMWTDWVHQEVGTVFGEWISEELILLPISNNFDAVIPVPLHKKRLKERGYNQVTNFGIAIANKFQIPCNESLLHRNVYSKTQSKKDLLGRISVIDSLFDVTFNENDHNKHFLLIDDVLTTGATLEACGRALLKIPGAKISIVCMAMSHS